VVLVKYIARSGLDALTRDLLVITQLALASRFYFRGWQAQGRANQRRNSENWTLEWPKTGPFIVKLSCDCHMISHKTFLILVTLFNVSCSCHVIDHKTFLFLVSLLNISCSCHVIGYNIFLFLVTLLNILCVTVMWLVTRLFYF